MAQQSDSRQLPFLWVHMMHIIKLSVNKEENALVRHLKEKECQKTRKAFDGFKRIQRSNWRLQEHWMLHSQTICQIQTLGTKRG